MKDYVVHLTPLRGLIASVRIAKFIGDQLSLDVLSTLPEVKTAALEGPAHVGRVIVVNGPPAFCKFREELAHLLSVCKSLVWVQNDFTIYPPSQTNRVARKRGWVDAKGHVRPPTVWSTIPDKADTYLNWNALTMHNAAYPWGRHRQGLLYYGAFRQGRTDRFYHYLPRGLWTTISAPVAATKRFQKLFGPTNGINFIEPLDDVVAELAKYEATIMLQDKRSDDRYMSLPNRFYEALSAGVAMYISAEFLPTLAKAGYKVEKEWIITHNAGLLEKPHKKIAEKQHAAWMTRAVREKVNLKKALKKAYKELP